MWFLLDEVGSLQKLPQLVTAVTENRQSNNPVVIGIDGLSERMDPTAPYLGNSFEAFTFSICRLWRPINSMSSHGLRRNGLHQNIAPHLTLVRKGAISLTAQLFYNTVALTCRREIPSSSRQSLRIAGPPAQQGQTE